MKPTVKLLPTMFDWRQGRFTHQARVRMPDGRIIHDTVGDDYIRSFVDRNEAYASGVKLALRELRKR